MSSTVPDYVSNTLKIFSENGMFATINTDDPGISGIDLAHEYQIAAPAAGLSPNQIHQAQYPRDRVFIPSRRRACYWRIR